MSTSSTPPDKEKPVEAIGTPDNEKPVEALSTQNESKPTEAISTPDAQKPIETVSTPDDEKPIETVSTPDDEQPIEAASTPNDEKPGETVNPPDEKKPRDAAYWAQQISTFKVSHVPTGALNLNVEGKQALSPLQGFGQMWKKTYRTHLHGTTVQPVEVIKAWKEHFPKFWPAGNRFYAPLIGIAPGEVALINSSLGAGIELSTGVVVLYADEESFTLMTPQGHLFAGWITFSAYEEDDYTVAQVQVLIRGNDPLYEAGLRLFAHKAENALWEHTLRAVATHFEVMEAKVEIEVVCLDSKLQWSEFWNIWHNAGVRTMIHKVTTPVRWLFGRTRR